MTKGPRRIMTYTLLMSAFKIGNPVANPILPPMCPQLRLASCVFDPDTPHLVQTVKGVCRFFTTREAFLAAYTGIYAETT
jgi:hypothetical protein